MASCEMCGKSTELVLADVEGVELKVCEACSSFGTIRRRVDARTFIPKPVKPEGPQFQVVDNYASLLHSAREKKKMTQEEFAKLLQEKESVFAHWEAGSVKPSIETAQRVGRILGINLIEQEVVLPTQLERGKKTDELTLGDFVKVRKRK